MGITIKQAYEQGSLRLAFACFNPECMTTPVGGYRGPRSRRMKIEAAMKRWGEARKLDEIPARCTRCSSADFVSVAGEPPGRLGKRGSNR